jgi:hypothetical protein
MAAALLSTGADDLGGERVQGGEGGGEGGELDIQRGGVLLDPLHPLGPGDRNDRRAVGEARAAPPPVVGSGGGGRRRSRRAPCA